MKDIVCPVCNGNGKITPIRPQSIEYKKEMIRRLVDNKCSIRQIARIMDYKSPRSIQLIMKEMGLKSKKAKK